MTPQQRREAMIAETLRAEYAMSKPMLRHLNEILVGVGTALLIVMIVFPKPFLISGRPVYIILLLIAAAMAAVVLGTRPVRLLSKPKAHFIIDAAGIHADGFGLPLISWESLRRISIKYRVLPDETRKPYLCVDYNDLAAAAAIHDIVRRRPRLAGHILIAPGRVCIDFSPMRPSIDDACRAIAHICADRAKSCAPVPILNLELPGKELQVIITPPATAPVKN